MSGQFVCVNNGLQGKVQGHSMYDARDYLLVCTNSQEKAYMYTEAKQCSSIT